VGGNELKSQRKLKPTNGKRSKRKIQGVPLTKRKKKENCRGGCKTGIWNVQWGGVGGLLERSKRVKGVKRPSHNGVGRGKNVLNSERS